MGRSRPRGCRRGGRTKPPWAGRGRDDAGQQPVGRFSKKSGRLVSIGKVWAIAAPRLVGAVDPGDTLIAFQEIILLSARSDVTLQVSAGRSAMARRGLDPVDELVMVMGAGVLGAVVLVGHS